MPMNEWMSKNECQGMNVNDWLKNLQLRIQNGNIEQKAPPTFDLMWSKLTINRF